MSCIDRVISLSVDIVNRHGYSVAYLLFRSKEKVESAMGLLVLHMYFVISYAVLVKY